MFKQISKILWGKQKSKMNFFWSENKNNKHITQQNLQDTANGYIQPGIF